MSNKGLSRGGIMSRGPIVVFDREEAILSVLNDMIHQCSPATLVLTTTDPDVARQLIQKNTPRLIITEAIPVIDIRNAKAFSPCDPGFLLIKSTREDPSEDIRSTWIIVLMSRTMDDLPDQVRKLLGERSSLFEKPPNFRDFMLALKCFTRS